MKKFLLFFVFLAFPALLFAGGGYEGDDQQGQGYQGSTYVVIPYGVSYVDSNSGLRNKALTSVKIPSSVTIIGNNAFSGNLLTSVTIPDSVTSIGDYAFNNNRLTSVFIGNSVTTIGREAFQTNRLTSVTIPDSVTNIDYDAFYGNGDLKSITIGANVRIDSSCFPLDFRSAYTKNNSRAGTYTYQGRINNTETWSYSARR
jgi:hypothetical protein